jgi:carotenoid cleavage dioxygenase-like enzyme
VTAVDETAVAEDLAPLLERAFFGFEAGEHSYPITRIEGEIPSFLRGRYYLAGPSRFDRGGFRYRHWLDGDGTVSALRFEDGGVHFTHRFVRGTKWTDEEAAGEPLYRTFGTAFDGDRLVRGIALASPLNVSVLPFAGTLLAFGEQGLPWELDPVSLETRGAYTFGRRLNEVSPFSAHPVVDLGSGEMFNFGISFSATAPMLNLYRFTADGSLADRWRVPIDAPRSVHDFALSPRHAAFYLSPYVLDMAALAAGGTLMEALSWEPERGSRLLVLDRRTGEQVASLSIGSRYCLHLIGSFEAGDLLMVDAVELGRPVYDQYDVPQLFPDARGSQPVRYVVDVQAGKVVGKVGLEYRSMCDFPHVDPRLALSDYRDFWVLGISQSEHEGRKFFDQLVHCDWRRGRPAGIYQAPPCCYLGGEPVMVPDPAGERRGAIVCQQYDAEADRGAFLIFDAFNVAAGPRAVLHLEAPVRLGFHATFEPEDRSSWTRS